MSESLAPALSKYADRLLVGTGVNLPDLLTALTHQTEHTAAAVLAAADGWNSAPTGETTS